MCQSIVNIQSPTAEIRRGKKRRRRKKKQDENIMVCPITQGDHKYVYPDVYILSTVCKFQMVCIIPASVFFSGTFPWIYSRLCQIQRSTRLNIQILWMRKLPNSLPKYQVSKENLITISKTLEYFLYTSFLCFLPDFINKCLLFIDVFKLKIKFNYRSKIFTDGCLSCHPTNNVKGLKDHYDYYSAT